MCVVESHDVIGDISDSFTVIGVTALPDTLHAHVSLSDHPGHLQLEGSVELSAGSWGAWFWYSSFGGIIPYQGVHWHQTTTLAGLPTAAPSTPAGTGAEEPNGSTQVFGQVVGRGGQYVAVQVCQMDRRNPCPDRGSVSGEVQPIHDVVKANPQCLV